SSIGSRSLTIGSGRSSTAQGPSLFTASSGSRRRAARRRRSYRRAKTFHSMREDLRKTKGKRRGRPERNRFSDTNRGNHANSHLAVVLSRATPFHRLPGTYRTALFISRSEVRCLV